VPPESKSTSGLAEGYRKAGPYMGLGIEFAASVILCFLAGRWVDGKIGTEPVGALVGFLVGTTAAIVNLIRSVNRLHDKAKERDKNQNE